MSAAGGVRAGIDWERRQRVDNWRVRKKGERKGLRMEFPKRKTRKHGLGACRFTGTIKVLDGCIQLPGVTVVKAGRLFASSKTCLWMEERTLEIVRSSVRM